MKRIISDKKVISLVLTLLVFTVGYFAIVNKISYAFINNRNEELSYDKLIEIIKIGSVTYGKKHQDIFNEEKIAYIKVQDLIDNACLATDEDGLVINPLNNESMNSKAIKLKYIDDKIEAEIDS